MPIWVRFHSFLLDENRAGSVFPPEEKSIPSRGETQQTALNERGEVVNGRGDTPNTHDILTGSKPDGTAFGVDADRTCANWTSSGAGAAMVGHSDRTGLDESAPMKSWNSSHPSSGPGGGCSQDDLISTGGAGLLYCFAAE